MIDAKTVHERMLQDDPEYAREYEALGEEFALAEPLARATGSAALTPAPPRCTTPPRGHSRKGSLIRT